MAGSINGLSGSILQDGAYTGAQSVAAAANVFVLDCSGYNAISVQITSAGGTCTVTYEQSNDNTTWIATNGVPPTSATGASTSTGTGLLVFPVLCQYFRARVSTYGSGTVTAFAALKNLSISVT